MGYLANISLPFADLTACASWSGGIAEYSPFQLTQASLTPTLPEGMSVDLVISLVGTLSCHLPIHDFSFALRFSSRFSKGSLETGENLDAQSFENGRSLVMLGTEDGDALTARMPWFEIRNTQYPVGYLNNGFELFFDYVPPKSILDFHFVIAYNTVKSDNDSEWFAVDVPHHNLVHLKSVPIKAI